MDTVEFRQVMLNLAMNAADAMPHGGVLQFQVRLGTETPARADIKGGSSKDRSADSHLPVYGRFPALPCICVSVQDNGNGIAAQHLPNLFDPFFSTKTQTKGSGLSLYNARVFVQEHGGAISVESAPGAGTTFHLWLPQSDFTEADQPSAEDSAVQPRKD